MITIQDIIKWSKPHPLAKVISLKDRKGGRMSKFIKTWWWMPDNSSQSLKERLWSLFFYI